MLAGDQRNRDVQRFVAYEAGRLMCSLSPHNHPIVTTRPDQNSFLSSIQAQYPSGVGTSGSLLIGLGRRLGEHRRWSQSGHKTGATLQG